MPPEATAAEKDDDAAAECGVEDEPARVGDGEGLWMHVYV